jgi:trehalose 6-phosphate phosphatase
MNSSEPPLLTASAALFLDFDGTLAPMAPRPQDVQVLPWVVPALRSLSHLLDGALAIVSGRPLAQLDAFLAPLALPAAGAHGAEWRGSTGEVKRLGAEPPGRVVEAARQLARHDGILFEPKPAGLAVHYRARPELEATCRDTLVSALAGEPGADITWGWLHGHFVFELKQRAVSKGRAVDALMKDLPFAGRQPVFVGDDQTDEDGIAAAQAAGGYGIRVGGGDSQARYRLANVAAVGDWLLAAVHAGATDKENA